MTHATDFLFDLGLESGMERRQFILLDFENNNVNDSSVSNIMERYLLSVISKLVMSFIMRIE